ncbi:hypothetical protein TNCV_846781 [Trichonephila clavipes]|nr:hypothetical protein TNCV_846781 [Trichonephila clavipes]
MSLAVAIIRSRSKGLEAEPKITYVHKLCSRHKQNEMSSETNSVLDSVWSIPNPGEKVRKHMRQEEKQNFRYRKA